MVRRLTAAALQAAGGLGRRNRQVPARRRDPAVAGQAMGVFDPEGPYLRFGALALLGALLLSGHAVGGPANAPADPPTAPGASTGR